MAFRGYGNLSVIRDSVSSSRFHVLFLLAVSGSMTESRVHGQGFVCLGPCWV